jgi:hypothetical protein
VAVRGAACLGAVADREDVLFVARGFDLLATARDDGFLAAAGFLVAAFLAAGFLAAAFLGARFLLAVFLAAVLLAMSVLPLRDTKNPRLRFGLAGARRNPQM